MNNQRKETKKQQEKLFSKIVKKMYGSYKNFYDTKSLEQDGWIKINIIYESRKNP